MRLESRGVLFIPECLRIIARFSVRLSDGSGTRIFRAHANRLAAINGCSGAAMCMEESCDEYGLRTLSFTYGLTLVMFLQVA